MNNTYEVHCSGRNESELDHDYNILEVDVLNLYRSYSKHWEEKSRGERLLTVVETKNGIIISVNGIKKLIQGRRCLCP